MLENITSSNVEVFAIETVIQNNYPVADVVHPAG
jgi:hypothetical protein